MAFAADGLSTVVAQFYEAAANPELWPDALDAIAKASGSRGALLPTQTFTPGRLPHSRGMGDVLDQFFSEGWHRQDLRTTAARPRIPGGGFVADQHLFSAAQLSESRYYRSFAQDAGVPWFCAALIAVENRNDYVAVSLQRTAKEGAFGPEELAALESILPQLKNAAALAQRLARFHGQSLIEGLELSGEAALLIDEHCRVVAINAPARASFGDGLTIRRGKVCAELAAEDAALGALVAAACGAGEPARCQPVSISSMRGGAPMVVRAAPVRRSGSDVFGFSGAVLMLTSLASHVVVPEALLAGLFGLTRREAQIMSLVGQGLGLDRVALVLRISRDAVRFHLKAVFVKTNVHRQSELVAMHGRLRG